MAWQDDLGRSIRQMTAGIEPQVRAQIESASRGFGQMQAALRTPFATPPPTPARRRGRRTRAAARRRG